MKLIIQIPCYNEEGTLGDVLRDLPTAVDGVDCIETQIVDDGSTDGTAALAERLGVTHIVRLNNNRGLAAAFRAGVANALAHDVDILVNTDGDNQYCGADIEKLVTTMIREKADLVIGCRPIANHPEFSLMKKGLQLLGSWVVRQVSRTEIPDAASGFRAYGREALLHLNVVSQFSYCLETIIQAGNANMKIAHVPIRVNPKTRDSRLFKSIPEYVVKQVKTIVSMFILYRSNVFFGMLSIFFLLASILLAGRYVWLSHVNQVALTSFWPSVILSGILLVIASLSYLVGVLASLFTVQRRLTEETLYHLRQMNLLSRAAATGKTNAAATQPGSHDCSEDAVVRQGKGEAAWTERF